MKKVMMMTLFLLGAVLAPLSAGAQVSVGVNVNVPLPPPIVFSAPPQLVVIPETYVYAVPDVEADIFFSRGWWWRPWEGRWYRSRHYDGGWAYYRAAPPPFYRNVPPGWRNDYRDHRWRGHEWRHERIPHGDLERNWRGWERDKHWEHRNTWGVQGMEPRSFGPRGGGRDRQGVGGQPGFRPVGNAQRMERRPEGPVPMRAPQPAREGQWQHGTPHGQPRQEGRAVQPGQPGPRAGGPTGGPGRGPAPGRGHDNRGGPGRR
jgi:hypothetical protein